MRGRESNIVVEALCSLYYMHLIAWYLFEQRKEEQFVILFSHEFVEFLHLTEIMTKSSFHLI